MDHSTLNQSILGEKDGGKIGRAGNGRRKEYSEELRPLFVRCQPIRFYGLQDGHDSDWLLFKRNSFNSTTVPPGCLRNFQCVL